MGAEDALRVLDALDRVGVEAWLDGGWAVDAALERQTRQHDDLDLVVELGHIERLQEALSPLGYRVVRGGSPKSFELVDPEGRQVDVHPVDFVASGDGHYLMENDDVWVYPAAGFLGTGRVLGRVVRCLSPEVQLLCHSGYEPHRRSYDDVNALCAAFGLPIPEEYRRSRESYEAR
jgi:lincosamide nucleotidyltransferase A/C/D/E